MKDQFLQFLRTEQFCVISTVSADGMPESAFLAFSENEALEIIIGTSNQSRKYRNLAQNAHVALVFGFDGEHTLQYEGVARELAEPELNQRLLQHFAKQPGAVKYRDDPANRYFVIKPAWLRLSEGGPKVLGEMRLNV